MKKGVITEEAANSRSAKVRPSRSETSWKAKPDPRSTMPSAARQSGMKSVDMIASKAVEKAVQRTTRTKISHT